ncbi:MAG: S53 family peptidase [Polyangia bacterium]
MRHPLVRVKLAALAPIALAFAACVGSTSQPDPAVDDPALTAAEPEVAPTSEPMSCATAGHTYHCKGRIRTDVRPLANAAAVTGYGPADLSSAYALNTALKPTTTIAVVDAFGYPNAESDLAQYRSKYGLPACTVASGCLTIVNQQGQKSPLPSPPPANDDWTVETALDLDMASAACPSCKLLLVQANDDTSNGLLVAQAAAANLGAAVISDSWGGPETAQQTGQSQESFFNLGKPVTIFVAAGDSGYDNAGQGPDYPSVSAYVIAVGGTNLKRSTTATRGWVETAWTMGGSSCSISVPKPTSQSTLTTACTFRAASDVAAVGDPATGLTVYNAGAGGFIVVGGTSASAPFVAGVFALNGIGAAGPSYPYAHATAWNDVTSGSNGSCGNVLCNAGKGWDGPTGLGTPIGSVLGGVTPPADMAAPPSPPDMASAPVATGGGNGTGSGNGEGGGAGNGAGNAASGSGTGGNGTGTQGGFVGGCSTAGAASSGAAGLSLLALGIAALAARRRRRA